MANVISLSALAELSAFLADAPESISLDDVRHHPTLARLVILADDVAMRVDRRALDWLKRTGAGCTPLPGEGAAPPCPMMGSNTPETCPVCGTPRGKGCGYARKQREME